MFAATAALTITATLIAPVPAQARGSRAQVTSGFIRDLPADGVVSGGAVMIRTGSDTSGRTTVLIHARGLQPNRTYPVHVHNLPCSATPPGGSHYQHVPGGAVDAVNEIWPRITTNGRGAGTGKATHGNRARPDAQAIVIHNPDDTSIRLACVDLK
jgi:hypothetical protein